MFIDFGGEGIVFEQTATLQLQKVTGSQDGRGKGKREHGRHSGEHGRHSEGDEYIGPSLRAIKPWVWETLFRRSLRMTKGGGYRLAQTATLQLQKVTGSQNVRSGADLPTIIASELLFSVLPGAHCVTSLLLCCCCFPPVF